MSVEIEDLKFENLTFGFEPGVTFLEDCNFSFPMNTVTRITGPAGAGKSTVLKLLAALHEPISGEYKINGQAINEMSFEELIPLRLKIGFGFDHGGLLNNRTLFENLLLPIRYHNLLGTDEAKNRVYEIMSIFGLVNSTNMRPSAVSGSQRKLTCIARAFLLNPQLLILDEPSQGLGMQSLEALISLIEERMNRGELKHVIMSTENPTLVDGLVERVISLEKKKIVDLETLLTDTDKGVKAG